MSSDSDRLKEVFAQALRTEAPAERESYLAEACKGDPELREQVDSLLRAHEQAGDFFSQTVRLPSPDFEPDPVGTMIGRYKLLEKIGEGGFGVVYLAEQQEPVQRKVALKIIKAGMDTREVIARFEAERQALAMMDHPNIAKVLDGGTTQAKRPYFVMELVHGIPITDYCDQEHLSTTERLRLFIKVCQAVQHAHQKAVIHRDLKPSNILVTLHDEAPVPKVIDFGVAKALGQKLTERTLFTAFRQMIGTPAYMAPEQAETSGLDVDTRSDIYSLGVLLYELLTGVTPIDKETLGRAAPDEIRNMIRETEPPKPSTRLRALGDKLPDVAKRRRCEPGALSRLVRGDLEWAVMKCLEKDRTRRYETANGLAMDLSRFLNNEPVTAAAPSALYRATKFVRRHRAALTTAAAFILLLVAGVVGSLFEAVRAKRAEREEGLLLQQAEGLRSAAEQKLWDSYLAQAQAFRWSGRPGRRFAALEVLDRAAAMRPSLELRNEAIACMALTDMRLTREWEGYPPGTTMLAFDEETERYARCNTNGQITVRRIKNDSEIMRLPGPGKPAWALAFSPNGKLLGARYDSGDVEVWDLASTNVVLKGDFGAFVFSPDSQRVAIEQGTAISVHDLTSRRVIRLEIGMKVGWLAFDPSGQMLAFSAMGADTNVRIWNAVTGKPLVDLPQQAAVCALAWHPSGRFLAVACVDFRIYVWDVSAAQRPIATLAGHRSNPASVTFAHHDDLLASWSWDHTVMLWDPFTGKQLVSDFGAPVVGYPQAKFSRDDQWLSFAIKGSRAGIWKVETGRECRQLRSNTGTWKAPWCLAFSPDGRLLASGHTEGVRLWDTFTGREIAFLPIGYTRTAVFDPSGKSLLTCREDAGVHRWPIEWGHDEAGYTLRIGPPEIVSTAAGAHPKMISLAADGKTLAVADLAHGQVIILGLENKGSSRAISGHPGIAEVTISPDARWVASATWGTMPAVLRVAAVDTGKLVLQSDSVESPHAAFSQDGRWFVSSHEGECRVWEVGTWKLVRKMSKESEGSVMTFTRDGTMLAFGQSPQAVKLLDVYHGWKELASLEAPEPTRYYPACFSPDGGQLAVVSDNQLIRLWGLRSIRAQLASIGLDWDSPPLPLAPKFELPIYARIELEPGEAVTSQAHQSR
jgi:WD40 repeat protein